MKRYRDTDYLHGSARVRALENAMVTRRDLQKMIDARTPEEAYKVLSDAAICRGLPMEEYEKGLERNLREAFALVEEAAPAKGLVRFFRLRYDGHNLKTAVKAKRHPAGAIYSSLGNLSPEAAAEGLDQGKLPGLPAPLEEAALEALDILARTGDPQMVDIRIDRGVLEAMAQEARELGNPFVERYAAAQADMANIRAAVRLKRLKKSAQFLGKVLVPGGRVPPEALSDAYVKGWDALAGVVSASPYGRALEPAWDSVRGGGSLSLFEKLCDNALTAMLEEARTIPFGLEPLAAYLAGKECETKAARIVMASKLAGAEPQQITERLRETYA